jgi:hypothetical protein
MQGKLSREQEVLGTTPAALTHIISTKKQFIIAVS